MKKVLKKVALLIVFCIVLGGCGNTGGLQEKQNETQKEENNNLTEEAEALRKENNDLKKEIESLKIKNNGLQEQADLLKKEKNKTEKEYDAYKQDMKKYDDFLKYADEIKDYGKLKDEIKKMEEKKEKTEKEVNGLTEQLQKLNQKIEEAKNPKPQSKNLLYSDKSVEIYFLEITSKGVVFEVKNLTDINLTFQADSIAINGISTNDIIMSDEVAPQSIGKIVARCSDFSTTEKVYKISGQLSVIDFSRSFKSYDAKFVNVEIK